MKFFKTNVKPMFFFFLKLNEVVHIQIVNYNNQLSKKYHCNSKTKMDFFFCQIHNCFIIFADYIIVQCQKLFSRSLHRHKGLLLPAPP